MSRIRELRRAALAAGLVLLLAPPAGAAREVSAPDALARLEAAALRCDLRGGASPLRLRALVRALRLSTGEHAGRYELAWDSPERWRREIRFQGYHSVDAQDGQGAWRDSGVPWVPVRVRQIQEGLEVATLLRLLPGERVASARSVRVPGGRRLEMTLTGAEDGDRQVDLDEESGLPLKIWGPLLIHEFSEWQDLGERAFPRQIAVSDSGGVIATVQLRRLAQDACLHPSLFERPASAQSRDLLPEPDAPEWEAYRARLAAFFRRSWHVPREALLGREGVVRLGFSVRRDGELRDLRLLGSSGSEALDEGAITAIAAAAPLPTPPLPPGEEALAISWSVVYNLAGDAANLAGANTRVRQPQHSGPRPVSGRESPRLASLDSLMLDFLEEQDAPGAALAVVKDGRLVHARGYGWSDHELRESLRPDALFRIASLSKPITAITVLSLVEDGRLSLDDNPWDLLGLTEQALAVDPRHQRLTVRLLLQHRGGFDRREATDPFLLAAESGRALNGEPAPTAWELVDGLASRPLDFEPGRRFAYSNVGYGLLGRVIEAASGGSYEEAVRERLLRPLGLEGVRLGQARAADRAPGEVRPHLRDPTLAPAADGSGEPLPLAEGGIAIESMDAHGGWLASVLDLARLSAALDRPRQSGLLTRRSLRKLWTRPPGRAGYDAHGRMLARWYGFGWNVRVAGPRGELEQWHDGRLPGSSARLVRQADGVQWIVLFNQDRGADGTLLSAALEPGLREALSRVGDWPELDLFELRP